MECETHPQRETFVYGGGDSRLGRGSPRDSSTEGETSLRRGRFIYGGEDSSTEARLFYGIFLRKSRILASMTDKGQRTRGGGREDRKQRSKGHEQWNRAKKRGNWDI
jgi:hypothetical protein